MTKKVLEERYGVAPAPPAADLSLRTLLRYARLPTQWRQSCFGP